MYPPVQRFSVGQGVGQSAAPLEVPATAIHSLTVKAIEGFTKASIYGDGGGLYIQVKRSGRHSWVFRFKAGGKTRWMGLGSYPEVGLADARDAADKTRKPMNGDGRRIDPIEAKREAAAAKVRAEAKAAAVALRTFRAAGLAYIAAHEGRP